MKFINEKDYQEIKKLMNKKDDYFTEEELYIMYKIKDEKILYQTE